jgi:hypothetical protein
MRMLPLGKCVCGGYTSGDGYLLTVGTNSNGVCFIPILILCVILTQTKQVVALTPRGLTTCPVPDRYQGIQVSPHSVPKVSLYQFPCVFYTRASPDTYYTASECSLIRPVVQ